MWHDSSSSFFVKSEHKCSKDHATSLPVTNNPKDMIRTWQAASLTPGQTNRIPPSALVFMNIGAWKNEYKRMKKTYEKINASDWSGFCSKEKLYVSVCSIACELLSPVWLALITYSVWLLQDHSILKQTVFVEMAVVSNVVSSTLQPE